MAASTEQRKHRRLSLMTLPSEIRLVIYRLFFSGQPRSITYPYNRAVNLIDDRHWHLLLVSKSVYCEALPEYYRTCLFSLYTLQAPHLQKMLKDMANSHFTRHATKLLVWKVPEPVIFQALDEVKWVKLTGIACGVQPDPANGQVFTYNSLMTALQKSRVPAFSWDRCQDLFRQYPKLDFMVDVRCDYYKTDILPNGCPRRKWIKTNFVYHARADTFIEDLRGIQQRDALILRPPFADALNNSWDLTRAFIV